MIFCGTSHFVKMLNTGFPSQFAIFFTIKSPSVIQRLVSQENAFKEIKNPYSIENKFRLKDSLV